MCAWRRDEKSKIVKQNDHLIDATRYLILSGLQVACREPREEAADERHWSGWLDTLYGEIETDTSINSVISARPIVR
jgi:hypothetical protein